MRCPYCGRMTWERQYGRRHTVIRLKCLDCGREYEQVMLFDVEARKARYVVRPAGDPKTGRGE